MASAAYTQHLTVLLKDAEELGSAHLRLRTGSVGRQWGLGALNRAVIVSSVSAWEAYVETLVLEVVEAAKPVGAAGVWSAWNASARSAIGRFNNPNPENVVALLRDVLGLHDVRSAWSWSNCTPSQAEARLKEALRLRHEVAHGVKPRPTVHDHYVKRLPGFFRRLGTHTDGAVQAHATGVLGIVLTW